MGKVPSLHQPGESLTAPSSRRVIICGSRRWTDSGPIADFLLGVNRRSTVIVHGAAPGADRIAGRLAARLGFVVEAYPADWRGRGRIAGPERNRRMLDLGADLVVAFKHDFDGTMKRGGTEHMVRIAMEAGIPTIVLPVDTRPAPGEDRA